MKSKKKTTTKKRVVKRPAKKAAKKKAVRKAAKKSAKKSITKRKRKDMRAYTYDTPISVLEEKFKTKSGMPPDTKLGDYFRENGQHAMARLLRVKF